jgi:hypothetical protein
MFRSHQPLSRRVRCCLCIGGPLSPRPSLLPAARPAHTRPIPQREHLPLPPVTSHQSHITKSFTIRTSTKYTPNPFRIRTSKTQDLKPFRMNTYKKTPSGEGRNCRSTTRLMISMVNVKRGRAPDLSSREDSTHSQVFPCDRPFLPRGFPAPAIVPSLLYTARRFRAISCIDKRLRADDSLSRTRTAFRVAGLELPSREAENWQRRIHVHLAA